MGSAAKREANRLADELRRQGLAATVGTGNRSLKAMLRQANSSGARWALVLGDQELADHNVQLRDLKLGEQRPIDLANIANELTGGGAAMIDTFVEDALLDRLAEMARGATNWRPRCRGRRC